MPDPDRPSALLPGERSAPPPRSLPQPGHLYDVAVVGAGLAGSELAWRLARAGGDVLLVTQALDSVGTLFHDRDPGPLAPGSLFDAARAAAPDPSPWALHREVKAELERTPGLHLLQSCVSAFEPGAPDEAGEPHVLRTWEGPALRARTVVFAVGSFLRGRLRTGGAAAPLGEAVEEEAGRLSEVAYDFLWRDLEARGAAFAPREDAAPPEPARPDYRVAYLTFAPAELDGCRLVRWPRAFALGRCTPGDLDYAAVLHQAEGLAARLTTELAAGLSPLPRPEGRA